MGKIPSYMAEATAHPCLFRYPQKPKYGASLGVSISRGMGEEKGAWLHDGVLLCHEGERMCLLETVCACVHACVKVKGRLW